MSGLLWIDSGVVSRCHLYGFEFRLFLLIDWLPHKAGKSQPTPAIGTRMCRRCTGYVYLKNRIEESNSNSELICYIQFLANALWKGMKPSLLLLASWPTCRNLIIYQNLFWHPFLVRPRTFQQTPFYKAKTIIFLDINVISLKQTMISITTCWILLFPGVIFLNGMSFQDVSDPVSPQNLYSIHFYALPCFLGKDSGIGFPLPSVRFGNSEFSFS